MRRRRNIEAFSLSFLDCICCGFGAIILLLVLSKIYEPVVIEEAESDLEQLIALLQEELFDLRGKSAVLDRQLKEVRDDAAATELELAQLQGDLNRFELDVFAARSARYPQDLEYKFQLGLRLKMMENLPEAVNCFMEAAELPERRASAVLELGECLQRQRQYSKALECYLRGLDQSEQAAQPELVKLALYRAGLLSAGLKDTPTAIDLLARLVELDPKYKDAAARLDKIRQMDHK